MKRRSFLKSVLCCLGLVFVPKAETKSTDLPLEPYIYAPNNPNSKIKWSRYTPLEPSTKPLFDDLDSYGEHIKLETPTEPVWPEWKQVQAVNNHIKRYSNQIFGYFDEIN